MTSTRALPTAGLVLVILSALASAATADTPRDEPSACAADVKKLCKDVRAGGGRVVECLAGKVSQLSPTCRPEIEPVAPAVLAWRDACGADIDAKCGDKWVGHGLGKCLADNARALAPACRVAAQASERYLALACGAEVARLCQGVAPGDGRLLACVAGKASELTGPCATEWQGYDAAFGRACQADVAKHCGGDVAYDKAYPCLQARLRDLGAACRELVEAPAAPVPQAGADLGAGPFAGRYATNWGYAVCKQAAGEKRVECSTTYASGKLSCVANKSTLVCTWREGTAKGRATLVRGDGGHLTGTWGHEQRATGGGAWVFAKLD